MVVRLGVAKLAEVCIDGTRVLANANRSKTLKADNPPLRADLQQPVAAEDVERLPRNAQTKCFDKWAFVYDEGSDCFYCPAHKPSAGA